MTTFPCAHGHGSVDWPIPEPSFLTAAAPNNTAAHQRVTFTIRSTSSTAEQWRLYVLGPDMPGSAMSINTNGYRVGEVVVTVQPGQVLTHTLEVETHNVYFYSDVAGRYKNNDLVGAGAMRLPDIQNAAWYGFPATSSSPNRIGRTDPTRDEFYWGKKLYDFPDSTVDEPIGPMIQPGSVVATPAATSVALSWSGTFPAPAGFTATRYEVRTNSGPWVPVGTATSYTVPNLTPETAYTFAVRAAADDPGGPVAVPVTGITSTTTASGGAEGPEKLVDGSTGTKWLSSTVPTTATLTLAAAATVTSYAIVSGNDAPERDPRTWTLQGSNDAGATWTTVDTRPDEPQWASRGLSRSYTVTTPAPFARYRWSITATRATLFQAAELKMYRTTAAGVVGGDPLTATTTTLPDPTASTAAYRAVVRLGSHTWDVLAGDPPTYGPLLPLSFGWAVPEDSHGFPAQPDPETLSLELLTPTAAAMSGVDIGSVARVSIYTSTSPTARPLATFAGRVADLEAAPTDDGKLRWRVLGVGYTLDLSGRQVGAGEWPQESGDARAARIAAEAGVAWTSDAVGCTFEARGPQAVPARDELERTLDAAVTALGSSNGPARRVLLRAKVTAAGDLERFEGAAVVRRTDALQNVAAGFVNRRTTWRRTRLLDAGQVTVDHPGGPTLYGDPRLPAYPPQSLPITDPREYADLILDTTPGYRWLTGDVLRLELWATDAATVADWFYRDPASPAFPWSGRAIVVRNIAQAPDGSTTYAGMLAAARLILEPGGRLVVEFKLRPEIPADSTVTMRWMDEPAGATWAQELAADPAGDWYAYRTTPRP